MNLYKLHAEPWKDGQAKVYWNVMVVANDETEAIKKFRRTFNLPDGQPIRIENCDYSYVLLV